MKKIVILGAGFAGVSAYRRLINRGRISEFKVVVISRSGHFLFTPLLHEAAAGHIDELDPVVPLGQVFRPGEFIKAEVQGVDFKKKTVDTSNGEVSYDYLIIAGGSETEFYGVPGARQNALTLKTIDDAVRVKNLIVLRLKEISSGNVSPGKTTFVVVGGGATGVELIAELADLFNRAAARQFSSGNNPFRIILLDGREELLIRFPKFMRDEARKALNKAGVVLELGARVLEVISSGIRYAKEGKELFLESENVIWTAGVRPVDIKTTPEVARIGGRIAVDRFLMTDISGVFAAGDGAIIKDDYESSPYLAQAAETQARTVADNIISLIRGQSLRPFKYHSRGRLVSLGRFRAIGEVAGVRIGGLFGWWMWRTVYLFKIPSLKKRLMLVLRWTLDIFSRRDLPEVI